ncbi:Cu(I)-responsive transcriptional regulator [Hoeflea poritis]|uniref:Cu(I)-responsive transcriptional regulator n=1 Tax=Hoeflea poritis TaxID=2993659 RepID=A0ABT4VHK7_9HYPH|nr:Cu(I)-responsive transcriptional regulator [Hoeflea poritis]MDA4844201.1 Cu(I)-responsive transcriptional regulator [Hoeflea poritis]
MLTIGDVARASGLPTKTVRYYADIGLVQPDARSQSGYRLYSDTEVRKLIFVRRARAFGFSVEECRELLDLYGNRDRPSRDVKNLALQRIAEIERKMLELEMLHKELSHLADACRGDDRPDCPILSNLADDSVSPTGS